MQGSESLITDIVILSWPGALLDEKDIIILRILWVETVWNWNLSATMISRALVVSAGGGRLWSSRKDLEAWDALTPTETKKF